MFTTDPHIALDMYRQRSHQLQSEVAADALAGRVSRHAARPRELWRAVARRRAPAMS
ncbi:hypothetical protein [Dactylosporangium sp. CA-139066]|uniref:hypothetical protein n=1 Tax=Dactylosporangium sp. CA-139066 TaxID=3239930 RepID=UPI003D8DA80D